MPDHRQQLDAALSELEASLERLVSARGQVQPGLVNEFRFSLKNVERYFALSFDGLSVREARRIRVLIKHLREAGNETLVTDPARFLSLLRAGTSLLESEWADTTTAGLASAAEGNSPPSSAQTPTSARRPVTTRPPAKPVAGPAKTWVLLLLIATASFGAAYYGFQSQDQGLAPTDVQPKPDSERDHQPVPTHRLASPLGRELSGRSAFGVEAQRLELDDPLLVIDWLEQHFSREPLSQRAHLMLLEELRTPPEQPLALAEELARKAVLTRYASHEALLPSEVLHAQGAEALGLAVFFAQSALRLGLPFDGLAQTETGITAVVDGKAFGISGREEALTRQYSRSESSLLILDAVKARALKAGDPQVERLTAVKAYLADEAAGQQVLLQLRDRLLAQLPQINLGQLAWLRRFLAADSGETLGEEQCAVIDRVWQQEIPVQVLERWLSLNVRALDRNGVSVAARLSERLEEASALSAQRRRQLLLWSAEATPLKVVTGYLDRFDTGEEAQAVLRQLTPPQWDFGELRMLRALVALGRGNEMQAMAELEVAAKNYPALATSRVLLCVRHYLVLALNHDLWDDASQMLDYARHQLPHDQTIDRLEAELLLAQGKVEAARVALAAYLKRYPSDDDAAASLAGLAIRQE